MTKSEFSSSKVGVLTPVYRGDLNDTDQLNLRAEFNTSSGYTAGNVYKKDSWDMLNTNTTDRFNDDLTELSPKGFRFLGNLIKVIIENEVVYDHNAARQGLRLAGLPHKIDRRGGAG
jgi:hypothetical protein